MSAAWLRRIAGMFRRDARERDLAAELESHLQMHIDDNVRRGMSADDARRDALRKLGGLEQTKEDVRDRRGIPFLEAAAQDVRYGARMLRKHAGFTAVAVATLALGIGANSALFSVVAGVLLNPLPFPDADRLVTLHESKPNFEAGSLSYPNFLDWQKGNRTFSAMAVARRVSFSLTGRGEAEQVDGQLVSSDFFPILGVRPVLGRMLLPGEDAIGAHPVALISSELWKRRLGGSASVLGSALVLDGQAFTVVGVVPAGFDWVLRSAHRPQVFLPIGQWGNPLLMKRGAGLGIHGIGRLKPGVPLARARADLDRVARSLAAAYPEEDKGVGATLIPLRQIIVGDVKPFLLALFGAVGFVLLIACVNVANLLLARSAARTREFGIRAALGAGRGRLIRQLLTESLLLSAAGGGLGLLLASRMTRAGVALLGAALPRSAAVGIDGRVLAFTAGVSIAAGLFFGLIPSLRMSKQGSPRDLHETGRAKPGGRAQSVFVIFELAMALVLLIGAGLMLRTLTRLWSLDPGFDARSVLTFDISLPPTTTQAPAIREAIREIDGQLGAIPGVDAASLAWSSFPMTSDDEALFWPDGQPRPANSNDMNWTLKYIVEPGYRQALGLRLRRGRFLQESDDVRSPLVAVVDDVFARQYFGSSDPVGRRINIADFDSPARIVGVVSHVRQWGLVADDAQKLRAQLYLSFAQLPDAMIASMGGSGTVAVRSRVAPTALAPAIRRVLQARSGQVAYGFRPMEEIVSESVSARKYSMALLGSFAALALLLSAIGIYGVISFAAGQRRGEIGVRMALGAQRADILRLIVGQGGRLAAAGIAAGVLGSLALTRTLSGLLFGVSALDPLTFAGMAVLLAAVALGACYLPARAAARLDPITVLRAE